jgi:hypothetical protein
MTIRNDDFTRHSPDKLLNVFSKGHLAFWTAVAVAAHLVAMVLTSMGYMRDHWIDPEGAAARKAAAEAAAKAKSAPPAPPAKPSAPAAPAGTAAVARVETSTNAVRVGGEAIPADRTNAPVVHRITEAAKPEEIPSKPGELGISLEDTNPR